jgi:hypothetical protein
MTERRRPVAGPGAGRAWLACVGAVFALVAGHALAADYAFLFVDVTRKAGIELPRLTGSVEQKYIVDTSGNGAAFLDYDGDNDLDALIVTGSNLDALAAGGDPLVALFRNEGAGRFRDVTEASGLRARGWGTGVCVADYDNDGFQDIYVTAYGPNVLWRNDGDGTLTATGQAADARWSTGCAFGDYDRDGQVDLYVANHLVLDLDKVPGRGTKACTYMNINVVCGPRPLPGEPDVLYRNLGDGTFQDVTLSAGTLDPDYYGYGVLFSDLNDDGWPDIYVANDSVLNLQFRNLGNGNFREEALISGTAVSRDGRSQSGMGAAAGDYDGDGRLDLAVTNFSGDYTTLYRNEGEGLFQDVSFEAGLAATLGPYLGWGVGFVDLDNNGWLDLFVANGHTYVNIADTGTSTFRQRNQLFRNTGNGRFREVGRDAGAALLVEKSSRGTAFGDYDNDGDLDILINELYDQPTLLRNDTAGGHWVTLRLEGSATGLTTTAERRGRVSARSNRDAIGAKVTLVAGRRRQVAEVRSGDSYVSHSDMRVHFGLGETTQIDRVEIRWPNGVTETIRGLQANRFYVVREGMGAEPLP